MALTKNDLQEIGKIIRNELDPVKTDLSGVKTDLSGVKTDLSGVKTDIADLKKSVKKIERNVEDVLGFLDQKDVELGKRITKVEKHLNLPQN
ncbi:MAG: hypothetical protein Q7T54_03245 [Candidatus Levybacteria bacterium]|nr:hypothetical protein [Candidatus Levybacteria bacterium]